MCRVDASAAGSDIFIGGWLADSLAARQAFDVEWFLFAVPVELFSCTALCDGSRHRCNRPLPCSLHGRAGQHCISAAELLASAVALALWGPRFSVDPTAFLVTLARLDTDSKVAEQSTRIKWYSSSQNLQLSLRTLVHVCLFHRVRPILSHCAGDVNVLADAITRFRDPSKASLIQRLPLARRRVSLPSVSDVFSVFSVLQAPELYPLAVGDTPFQ